jgi:hypothetical protein
VNDAETVAAMPEQIASVEPVSRSVRRPLPAHLPGQVQTYLPKPPRPATVDRDLYKKCNENTTCRTMGTMGI